MDKSNTGSAISLSRSFLINCTSTWSMLSPDGPGRSPDGGQAIPSPYLSNAARRTLHPDRLAAKAGAKQRVDDANKPQKEVIPP